METDYVDVHVGLPPQIAKIIEKLCEQGIIGNRPEEVILHVLREYFFRASAHK